MRFGSRGRLHPLTVAGSLRTVDFDIRRADSTKALDLAFQKPHHKNDVAAFWDRQALFGSVDAKTERGISIGHIPIFQPWLVLLLKLQAFVDQLGNAAKYRKHLFDIRLLVELREGVLTGGGENERPSGFDTFCRRIPVEEFRRLLAACKKSADSQKFLNDMAQWELETTQSRSAETRDRKKVTFDDHEKRNILDLLSARWKSTLVDLETTLTVSRILIVPLARWPKR